MPSAITDAHLGPQRRRARRAGRRVSSIQIMSPWAPVGEPLRAAARPLCGAASARAMPNAAKPSARASLASRLRRKASACLSLHCSSLPRRQPKPGRSASDVSDRLWRSRRAGLVKRFDGKPAVDGVDLAVPEGSDLRHPRPQRRRQDDDAAHAARHHRSRRGRARAARPRAAARGGARRSAICPRSAASIRR